MTLPRRIAVTGAGGRLGSALVAAIAARDGTTPIPWTRAEWDLDRPAGAAARIGQDHPELVLHAAAWTDVDGCAREPERAMARNAEATGELAAACAAAGIGLAVVSTNEVFDGERTDGQGYAEDDPVAPRNAYGASKLGGERAAAARIGGSPLWIVRTAWVYGPPGAAFPEKIVAAADRLPPGEALPVVADEHGAPTRAADLAAAILALVDRSPGGTFHLTNAGATSRCGWAAAVLAIRRPERTVRAIGRHDFPRASDPPPWGVLATGRAAALGVRMRPWEEALAEHLHG